MNVMLYWRRLQLFLMLLAGCFAAMLRADAQGFGLTSSVSAPLVLTNTAFVYSTTLTNFTGFVQANIFVTNTFSAGVSLVGTANSAGTNDIEGASVVFSIPAMSNNATATMLVTNFTTNVGFLTNTIVTGIFGATNLTNILVVQVASSISDLGVQILPPLQAVITNDLTSYDIIVTNFGPGSASGVLLTNTLPPGALLKSASQGFGLSGSNLIFSLGTLGTGSGVDVRLYIQPTNVEAMPLSASVGAPGLVDPNVTNNVMSTNVDVTGYLDGTLSAMTTSPQTNNLQNGLLEQAVLLSNTGVSNVPAARLVVTGLTNQLFNAVGTNGTSPFVYLSAPLAAGDSVTLVLQYNPRKTFPFTNGQLHAFAVPLPKWPPARVASTSTNVNISKIVRLISGWNTGRMLIEFPSTLGQTYTVVYSDDASFSNAMIAPPAVIAPANRVQWIDYGPPTTPSAPANSTARFYRVYQNP
ncbi:MAG TPA: hypothetical protein VK815_03560 [Candidatus Acidoferrales bacterium]|nr:hypothetical protein [Candidatus Acidoferrales bacterium]